MANSDELIFLPLGGVGEIGMNLALYGFGPPAKRQWIMVDCGVTFAGPDLPGVDLVLPDIAFIKERRKDLKAIIITHAHEDHYGALSDLWRELNVAVYASPFTAGMLEAKREFEASRGEVPINIFKAGDRINVGPFEIEAVAVTHSIPEPMSLFIRTPLGNVVHTGDWKIDMHPSVGPVTDETRFRALGDEGVLALMCDSTNAMREGIFSLRKRGCRKLDQDHRRGRGPRCNHHILLECRPHSLYRGSSGARRTRGSASRQFDEAGDRCGPGLRPDGRREALHRRGSVWLYPA